MFYFVHPKVQLIKNPFIILKALFKPLDLEQLKKQLSYYFPNKQFTFFPLGRIAFEEIIIKYQLANSHLIMPGFICDTFLPILQKHQITPIFLDIELNTFNPSPAEIKQKITGKVKAILINHTYGLPNNMPVIRQMLDNLNLAQKPLLVEDLSHSFGAKISNQYVGNFSDIAFASLYKQFPTMSGGILIEPGKTSIQTNIPKPLNKMILNLFSDSLKNLPEYLVKRRNLAGQFQTELKQLGFTAQDSKDNIFTYVSALMPKHLTGKRDKLRQIMQKKGVRLGRVWHQPINLNNSYTNTLEASQRIVNFPLQNNFSSKDIAKIIKNLKSSFQKIRI